MQSTYRDGKTVGSMYLDAQKNSVSGITLGEISSEIANSLVEDLNKTIQSNPFSDRPFFINVVEERDLQMKNAIKRRLFLSLYRPFPEDNTLVFHVYPKGNLVYFCWDIPHHSEMREILSNFAEYDQKYIMQIYKWSKNDLTDFGFLKVKIDNNMVPGYTDKTLEAYRQSYLDFLKSKGMSEKAIEQEIKLGYFWVPNKQFTENHIVSV